MLSNIDAHRTPTLVLGLSNIHKAHFIYAASCKLDTPILVITDDEMSAKHMCEDINAMHGEDENYSAVYPSRDFTFRQVQTASKEYEHIRIGVLSNLVNSNLKICFASIEALMQRTIPKAKLKENSFKIDLNSTLTLDEIIKKLLLAGYTSRPQVEGVAQFSKRGGILDVYPPNMLFPVRLEFWGDEIDSIATFEVETQRRIDSMKSVKITPASECLFENNAHLKAEIEKLVKKTKFEKAKVILNEDIARLESDTALYSTDKYLPLAYEKSETLLDYFASENTTVFFSETVSAKERARAVSFRHSEDLKFLFEQGELTKGLDNYYKEFSIINESLQSYNCTYMDTFARTSSHVKYKEIVTLHALQTSNFSGELKILQEDITPLLESDYCVCVFAGNEKSALNLAEDLKKMGLDCEYKTDVTSLSYGKVYVLSGMISGGFEYANIKFCAISTTRAANAPSKKSRFKKGRKIRDINDLSVGDLVVHVSHGIGVFDGINKMELQGVTKDYIKIKYSGADILYVPVTQLDLVSKYIGPKDESSIKLNRLNSGEWQKTKNRVRKACMDMADELIKLYAKRMQIKGHAFSEDNNWQREFEDHFEYTETEDQLRCAYEIKSDMQNTAPMDRLLCGDVGFGKTEVAFRAAFKAVVDSKQCAILCPTTILAWQHYQSAKQRFENYPITIELLSRFRSPRQNRETIKRLKTGEVDIVIGTHRLVQKDVEFHDLGLAIIDEEQRFGVAHKEKFKEMFTGVDMLTLSATPIPRTLNMAMSGIRDMSTIENAPQDRHPVQSYVMEYDEGVIADAIKKELRRNGQVYYIHNRVESIELCAGKIKNMVPEAIVDVAHGKMSESELSEVWKRLVQREIDVLVCTTLIETGVDVKNCNTLIIENADHMGLSQLYQLRGRVGRSNRRAFAYFTFTRSKVLTEIATKRLSAIREFTAFGSGFRIAMRDLEIRGAGSILSGRQHGHMESVGYDMYVRLLSEAIDMHKGLPPTQKAHECLIDIRIDAHIPEYYIENLSQRIDVYKKIASINSEEDKSDLIDELIDRFGDVPQSVLTLLEVGLVRNILASYGFAEINQKMKALVLIPVSLNPELANKLVVNMKGRVLVNASTKPYITIKLDKQHDVVSTLKEVSTILAS